MCYQVKVKISSVSDMTLTMVSDTPTAALEALIGTAT